MVHHCYFKITLHRLRDKALQVLMTLNQGLATHPQGDEGSVEHNLSMRTGVRTPLGLVKGRDRMLQGRAFPAKNKTGQAPRVLLETIHLRAASYSHATRIREHVKNRTISYFTNIGLY